MKTFFVKLKNEHIFLFSSLILSFIISILFYLICILSLDGKYAEGLIYFISPILVLLIVCLSIKTAKKYPKLTKIFSFLFNTFIIVVFQIFVGFSALICTMLIGTYTYSENPDDYSKALKAIHFQERIAHFPKVIPTEAEDVELYQSSNNWFGSENLMIKFSIDKKYIDNELKKYKFISIENRQNSKYNPARIFYSGEININDFTFYVINDKNNEIPNEHSFLYHYGLGVNKDFSKIIYYYICPD